MARRIRLGYSATNTSRLLSTSHPLRGNPTDSTIIEQTHRNVDSLRQILGYNYVNHIKLFRVGLWLIPQQAYDAYKDVVHRIENACAEARVFADDSDIRLTVHSVPLPLGDTARGGMVRQHLQYCYDLLLAVGGTDSVIELHLGGAYNHRYRTRERIVQCLLDLPESIRQKLALENDDKWTPADVIHVCENTKTQFVYDIFHHKTWPGEFVFNDGNVVRCLWAARTTATAATPTGDRTPLVHVSSQNPIGSMGTHAPYISYDDYAKLRKNCDAAHVKSCDIMIEATAKEKAVIDLRQVIADRRPRWAIVNEGYHL